MNNRMVCISLSFFDTDEIFSRGTTVGAKMGPAADCNLLLSFAAGTNGLNKESGKELAVFTTAESMAILGEHRG